MNEKHNVYDSSISRNYDFKEIIRKNLRCTYVPRSIEDLFPNDKKSNVINHEPYYQRNYVWDVYKATSFIESLLINTEIPPLIFFFLGDLIEIIDGRQRYETILRFLSNEFKLNGKGLKTLKHLAGNTFSTLDQKYVKVLRKIQLRIYDYELINNIPNGDDTETLIKREIFTRYNTGITPLTQLEALKAQYIDDQLNHYFKVKLESDPQLFNDVVSVFNIKSNNIQQVLKRIRDLLVLHYLPIHSYSYNKSKINKFYEYFSKLSQESSGWENIFNSFVAKLKYLQEIRMALSDQQLYPNGYVFECLFWILSICSKENISFEKFESKSFKKKLTQHILRLQKMTETTPAYRVAWINETYESLGGFFSEEVNLKFDSYIRASKDNQSLRHEIANKGIEKESAFGTNNDTFLRKDARQGSLLSVIKDIQSNICFIRPKYQREDVISKIKSSAIIESLLLGFRLPPIFVYKRRDNSYEVIDGQQRLLSCIAYLGISYTNENGDVAKSKKHNFKLFLKNGILRDLHNLRYKDLPADMKNKINDARIDLVEINEENNPSFDPVDLFMRLNTKPYPIRENTFESWNSIVDRRVTDRIKLIHKTNNDWFYFSERNERMHNEELITCLVYLQYEVNRIGQTFDKINQLIAMYIMENRLHFRFCNKSDITRMLTNESIQDEVLNVCDQFEEEFLTKIKMLLSNSNRVDMRHDLDEILNSNTEGRSRTNFRFYVLWILLLNIPKKTIKRFPGLVRADITDMFNKISKIRVPERFETLVVAIWNKYDSL